MKQLNQKQLERIKAVLPALKYAEKATGVPWEAVAAVWTRESFSVAPPKTPGGQMQFDPEPSKKSLMTLLNTYTNLPTSEKEDLVKRGVYDFKAALIFAACWLRHKCKPVINRHSSDHDIQDAFWGYNGRAYGSADKSPYVMNGYDAEHMDMRVIGSVPDGKGGRKRINNVDGNPGAFVVYKQLRGLSW